MDGVGAMSRSITAPTRVLAQAQDSILKTATKDSNRTVHAKEHGPTSQFFGSWSDIGCPSSSYCKTISSCKTRKAKHEFKGVSPAYSFGAFTPRHTLVTRPTSTRVKSFPGTINKTIVPGLGWSNRANSQTNL